MRTLNTSNYPLVLRDPDRPEVAEYDVRTTLANLLFGPQLQLSGAEAIKQDDLARKIMDSNGTTLLEEEEFQRLQRAVEAFRGYTRNEVPLLRRVAECPEVQVKPVE